MINLNDVLLAMSNIPVDDPIAEIWGRGLQGGDKIIEYTGSLPITIRANGDALLDYRIYGADGGVGDRTENLAWTGWAEDAVSRGIGSIITVDTRSVFNFVASAGYPDYDDNKWIFSTTWSENTQYTISFNYSRPSNQSPNIIMQVRYTDGSYQNLDNGVNDGDWHYFSFTTAANKTVKNICAYYASGWLLIDINTFMVIEGSTAPASYIPYGYKLPIMISNGNTAQNVPVYIGDTKLGEDEYVSFSEQKIYRDSSGTLTPTDPQVPLPEIPTVDGTTVIDYDGDPKPSQMYIKYKDKE